MAVCTEKNYTILNYEKQSALCPVPTIQTVKGRVVFFRNQEDENNIIGQYIIFCKVYNEQRKKYGQTKKAVTETIRICKDRNVLKEYLESKEQEVVDIMMTLFDDEQVLEAYAKDIDDNATHREAIENARIMLKNRRITVEEIPSFFPKLSLEDAKELEAEVMQLV